MHSPLGYLRHEPLGGHPEVGDDPGLFQALAAASSGPGPSQPHAAPFSVKLDGAVLLLVKVPVKPTVTVPRAGMVPL